MKHDQAKAIRNAWWRLLATAIGGLILLVGLVLYFDSRLERFEEKSRYRPPQPSGEAAPAVAADHRPRTPTQGQLVYVPAYSHIYHGDGEPYLLTITLSVRNIRLDDSIVVTSVRYIDTEGNEVKSYLEGPLRLGPLATTEILVARDDSAGGSGANFLVEWSSEKSGAAPVIEAVMIDTRGQQGISFARTGVVISERDPVEELVAEEQEPAVD